VERRAPLQHRSDPVLTRRTSVGPRLVRLRPASAVTGERIQHRQLGFYGSATPLAFSPDGHAFITGSDGPDLLLWDAADVHVRSRFKPPPQPHGWRGSPHDACFSSDGRLLAAQHTEGLCVWDVSTGTPILAGGGHHMSGCMPAFADDGAIVAADTGEVVRVWDTGDPRHWVDRTYDGGLTALAMTPAGDHIAVATDLGAIRLWERT
jgi:WD40 repeat protein